MASPQLTTLTWGSADRMHKMFHRPSLKTLLRWLALFLAGCIVLSWLAVLLLRFVPPWTSAMMMERRVGAWLHGEKDFTLHYRWVPWEEISRQVPLAVVAGEDQRFPYHHGFDFDAIQTALDAHDDGKRLRGASTISQQTAKNLFLWNGRSFVRKGLEAYFTVLIETLWPKRRILEVYLNIAEFGDGIYGAAAASERYFHKTPAQLDAHDSALLAAVLPNPRRYRVDRGGYVQQRAAWIERQAAQLGGPAYLPR